MSEPSHTTHWRLIATGAIALWLPIAAASTGLAVLIYVGLQQELRLGADDPQVALARATAERLDAGSSPPGVVPSEHLDLASSLDPFVLVFDADRHLIASSATLRGQALDYPTGVLDTARSRGESRVTWQPAAGVRSATVAVPWRGGYVVAGRSLSLTEQHVDQIGTLVGVGWLATLALVGVAALVGTMISPPRCAGAC